ncbi:hypothetical protein IWX90DRAFT_247067 [Phyllosticta citrichinensis]|uniref:Uncharacterized protein n=1 Tax=Phyllosticta citrichinensis TaxID=1130410 RepID=A0ABR1XQX1_9PEZI
MTDLKPPRKSVELEDSGAHELESSDGDEHFSDASEGRPPSDDRSNLTSPTPMTRVEKVDDEPSYGEVPGTDAYNKRTQDAVPDQVEIVPEGSRSRSASSLSVSDRPATPRSPGGTPVVVVEKVDPEHPSHGEVPGTEAYQHRQADAVPDLVLKAPDAPNEGQGSPTASDRSETLSDGDQASDESKPEEPLSSQDTDTGGHATGDGDQNLGDDFDDFEEGGQDEDFGDDFGDFDDGFQTSGDNVRDSFDEPSQPVSDSIPLYPSPSFEGLDAEGVLGTSQKFVNQIFPCPNKNQPRIDHEISPSLLSERSLSLWAQLVAPPPLQPPNWVRSRIRRLFLVSLGVPVDLDEILPASKQKKLVLPSIHGSGDRSPRPSADESANGAASKLRKEGQQSNTSTDSNASRTERKRRGPPPPPEFDVSATTMLCSTTEAALINFTDEELKAHVQRLKELLKRAEEVMVYWTKRKESAIGDKEAFEAVIENLVKHAKKVRK